MVGLPARGKSYLSNKLQRYLLVSKEPFLLIELIDRAMTLTALAPDSQWLEYEVSLQFARP
jgi:hypothetical protein